MHAKHKEHLNRPILKYIYFSSFLLGLASAFILYLESDYFKTASGSENISHYYIAAYAVALFLVINWHHPVRIFGKSNVFIATLFLKTVSIAFLAFSPVNFLSAWVLSAYMILTVLCWLDLDVLIECCSIDRKTGKIRGLFLTIENFGYLLAPFVAGALVNRYGFQAAFQAALAVTLVIDLVAYFKFRGFNHGHLPRTSFFDLLGRISHRSNVLRIYYISFLLEFFYALMIIYTPLYLLDLGFDWSQIGKIFTIMLVPFVLLQYPAGVLADKRFEEREMLRVALFVLSFSTLLIFFTYSKSVLIWSFVLFFTRVGASLIEILRDSYFYKRVDQQDVDIVDFFRTVRPIAYVIGPLIAAPIVALLGIKYIFLLVGIVSATGLFVARNLASSRMNSARIANV